MSRYLKNIFHNFVNFLTVQLFISLATVPILMMWGIPLSIMTPAGNLIFNPFLSIFLLCSSLIFFTELLCIPNQWLILILEKFTTFWSYCLSFSCKSWLFGFYQPLIGIISCIIIGGILLTHHHKWGQPLYNACLLLTLSVLLICIGFFRPLNTSFTVPCGRKKIFVDVQNGRVAVNENGALACKRNPEDWILYTLVPEIIKKTGRTTIDTMTVHSAHQNTFDALIALNQRVQVKSITLPYFNAPDSKFFWRRFFALRKNATEENTILTRSSSTKIS